MFVFVSCEQNMSTSKRLSWNFVLIMYGPERMNAEVFGDPLTKAGLQPMQGD